MTHPKSPLITESLLLPAARLQVGALCWRKRRGQLQVLLITSRETGRWVIPKGWQMPGREHHDAAAQEAWEEAGVQGQVQPQSLGVFGYQKLYPAKPAISCEVEVFPLRVAKLQHKFPERDQRRRKWFSATKAAKLVHEQGLSDLLLAASAQLLKTA